MNSNNITEKKFYYIWLQKFLGVGNNSIFEIIEEFGGVDKIYKADTAELKKSEFITPADIRRMTRINEAVIIKAIEYCRSNNIRIITPEDNEYPNRLRNIESPPAVIFARGLPLENDTPALAVVGARQATDFGLKAALSLSARLSLSGFTIISGGALGIDSMAHYGAIAAEGKTVMILGCGIDSDYLKSQDRLRKQTEMNGTVISEFLPKTPAAKYTFPIRNRLISALSDGVAVIEAGIKSGTLITANYAMEQGKDVFALPGNINMPQYAGTNTLIRDGVVPLISVDDIIQVYLGRFGDKIKTENELSPEMKKRLCSCPMNSKKANTNLKKTYKDKDREQTVPTAKKKQTEPAKKAVEDLNCSSSAKSVYSAFVNQTEPADILCLRSGIIGSAFISAITELELLGLIKAVPVGCYCLLA